MCGEALKSKLAFRGAHMKYTPKFLRGMLLSMIRKMGEHPEQYVRQHGWNLWHMSALFDLENGIYTDLIVQKEHEKNECSALSQMAGRSRVTGKVILLADRNYESCNNLALLEKRNWNYLIRIRDKARGIAYGMPLPDQPEFDIPLKLTLGRLTPRQLVAQGLAVPKSYYRITPTMTFDFLESNSPDFYEISFRVVRLQTDSGNTETLITNLDPDRFPLAALKALYARRWGIETSFRSLKYAVGLIHLHAKKPDLVLQEVFANFLVFNFTQAAAWAVDTSQRTAKYKRHVNFSDAVFACCAFLRRSVADLLPLLRRRLLPFRPGRTASMPKIAGNRVSACYASAR